MSAHEEVLDCRREMERRGQAIADAMGRYRGNEPLIEAVARLAHDHYTMDLELSRVRTIASEALTQLIGKA